jgi:hypothetical protein
VIKDKWHAQGSLACKNYQKLDKMSKTGYIINRQFDRQFIKLSRIRSEPRKTELHKKRKVRHQKDNEQFRIKQFEFTTVSLSWQPNNDKEIEMVAKREGGSPVSEPKNKALIVYDIDADITVNKYSLLDDVQRTYADVKGLRCCSTKTIEDGNCTIQYNHSGARYSGTIKCRSSSCVLCQGYANEKNRVTTKKALSSALEDDEITTLFTTLTIPRGDDVAEQFEIVKTMWKRLTYHLRRDKIQFGYIKQNDITFGRGNKKAFHLHLHTLLFIKGKDSTMNFEGGLSGHIKRLWRKIGKKMGITISEHAQDIQEVNESTDKDTLAQYVVKITKSSTDENKMSYEITSSQYKRAQDSNSLTLTELMIEIYKGGRDKNRLIAMYKAFTNFKHKRHFFKPSRNLWNILKVREDDMEGDVSNDDDSDKWDKSKKIEFHQTLFKLIVLTKLRGVLVDMLVGSCHGKRKLSYTVFHDLARQSLHLPYQPNIPRLQRLRKPFILFLGALRQENYISDSQYKYRLSKLGA